jgi:Ca2+-binding RTX toxin-like protein
VERLTLTGSAALNGVGNALANVLTGNAAANQLSGGDGNDSLNGAAGADTLSGGAGSDVYTVDNLADVVLELPGEGDDLVQASVNWTLGAATERLLLTGSAALTGGGNELDNLLTGNTGANRLQAAAGNDTLDGGAGADTLVGEDGNDVYVVDNLADLAVEVAGQGTDTVQAKISWTLGADIENLTLLGTAALSGTGNSLDNLLLGNSAANTLDGAAGADTLAGGAGNDTYLVTDAGEVVVELASGGTDLVKSWVSHVLEDNVENLTLMGTAAIDAKGNAMANTLVGNAAANRLDGGAGADKMSGGAGDDTYIVDITSDTVSETDANVLAGGTDTVLSWATAFTLPNYVEIGRFGTAGAANLTGSSSNNILFSGAGNNVLNGGLGVDTVHYGEATAGVTVSLAVTTAQVTGGSGTDTLAGLENIVGSAHADRLTGSAAANVLNGGLGADTLTGGAGADSFVFDQSPSPSAGVDVVTDFSLAQDRIVLSKLAFSTLGAIGALDAGAFFSANFSTNGPAAILAEQRVLYDTATGALYFDLDGVGGGAAVQFAKLDSAPALTAAHIVVG